MSDGEIGGRRRSNLGRGLDALFGEDEAEFAAPTRDRSPQTLAIDLLDPNPFQPRRRFDPADLAELTDSIREQGILQPLLVRPVEGDGGRFQIVAGERRWRAAQQAQLHEVPVFVRPLTDTDTLQVAIVENVQRSDLNALEEAQGYSRLIEEFGHTQEVVARAVGKSRSHVANTLRLLDLPPAIRTHLEDGRLSAGHGRALLGADDPVALADTVLSGDLNVRETEALARGDRPVQTKAARGRRTSGSGPGQKDPDVQALEQDMSALLGLRVEIKSGGQQAGSIVIHYQKLEQLDDVLHRLSQSGQP